MKMVNVCDWKKRSPRSGRVFLWSADISVRNRGNGGVERGRSPHPCERPHGARTFLSATVRAPAWEADKNVRAPFMSNRCN